MVTEKAIWSDDNNPVRLPVTGSTYSSLLYYTVCDLVNTVNHPLPELTWKNMERSGSPKAKT